MKTLRSLLPLLVLGFVIQAGCASLSSRSADVLVESEEKAVARLGDEITSLHVLLLNKKVGIFNFTTLDWSVSAPGKRIAGRLNDYLVKKKKIRMVSRTDFERIARKEAADQSEMYDVEVLRKQAGAHPIDAVIFGTVENAGDAVEIMVRVVDVNTGRRLLMTGVRMPSTGEITSKASADLLLLSRKAPEKIIAINKTYYTLRWMKARHPLVFLLVTLRDEEVKSLTAGSTVLGVKLKVRKERYERERPEIVKKIGVLKDGLALINRYAPQRSSEIARWKKEFLAKNVR